MTHLTSKRHTYQHALDSLRHLAQMLPPQSFQYHCKIYKTLPSSFLASFGEYYVKNLFFVYILHKTGLLLAFLIAPFPVLV